jgi:hypothetical protein
MKRARGCLAVVLLLTGGSSSVLGAEEDRVPPEIRACSSIRSKSERLACFDQAVSFLTSSPEDAKAKAPPSARDMFGMKASTPAAVESEQKAERAQVEAISAKITKLSFGSDGAILALDNGQTWSQISGSGTLLLKTGDEVKITRGALNSFKLTTPSGRIAKVRRVQ